MNYVARHWRGELSLAVSFWINFAALNLVLLAARPLVERALLSVSLDDDPRLMAQAAVLHVVFVYVVVYPWQIVGLWRAARRWRARTGRRGWGLVSQAIGTASVAATVTTLAVAAPAYRDILAIGFGPDRYGQFTVNRVGEDGELLHFDGYIGYRAARAMRSALGEGPPVRGVILDSRGGWIAAGRSLARVIAETGLDTYSFKGCHSACVTAFISGQNRYLADEARLGFHQYAVPFEHLTAFSDMTLEQQRDLQYFRRQGVRQEFLERLFQAAHDEVWFPSQRELFAAGAITGVVRSEEVLFGLYPGSGGNGTE